MVDQNDPLYCIAEYCTVYTINVVYNFINSFIVCIISLFYVILLPYYILQIVLSILYIDNLLQKRNRENAMR